MVSALITQLVKDIQDYSNSQSAPLAGTTKQQIALTVVDYLIKDLCNAGKIDTNTANLIITAINVLGGPLINFAAAAVKNALWVNSDYMDIQCFKLHDLYMFNKADFTNGTCGQVGPSLNKLIFL